MGVLLLPWVSFYSPFTLSRAYHFTQGQPFLLQMLGSLLIEEFDNTVLAGKQRSDFVELRDLEKAADRLVREESNAAFANYWKDASLLQKSLLSSLAHDTNEEDRTQLHLDGLLTTMKSLKFPVPTREKQWSL